jgi:hypothetical protein
MESYFVRVEAATDPQGPYPIDALETMAEKGLIHPDSLFYDDSQGSWIPISSDPNLLKRLFPQRTQLRLRRGLPKTPDPPRPEDPLPSVEELLLGDVTDPAHQAKRERKRQKDRINSMRISLLTVLLSLSALSLILLPASEIWNRFQLVNRWEFHSLLSPGPLLGLVDCCLALVLFLRSLPALWVLYFRIAAGTAYLTISLFLDFLGGTGFSSSLLALCALVFGFSLFILLQTERIRMFQLFAIAGFISGTALLIDPCLHLLMS